MSGITVNEEGRFEPWTRKMLKGLRGLEICPNCGVPSLVYRITHDDYGCLLEGRMLNGDVVRSFFASIR